MRVVSVGELTRYLKGLFEEDYYLQDVWIRGEVTNYTQSSAGHRYFSLKEEGSTLRCVLFAGRGMSAPPLRNGMEALAHGRLSFYEARGDCQFYVDEIEGAGAGALHLRFEALKARLEAEGLFALERKRPLPRSPAAVGVVTSASAAALRDIVRTLRLRCPLTRVILMPALVQGVGAAEQIAAALDALNAHGQAEVIIVARGGGSIEELWAFNEEVVARAIVRSGVPVVTGIGHETDFTIADFVADLRASTPTAAASMVVPEAGMWRDALAQERLRLDAALRADLERRRERIDATARQLLRASPQRRIDEVRRHAAASAAALTFRMRYQLALRREGLRARALQLHSLSPLLTLGRGFAIVRRDADGTLVTNAAQVAPGQGLTIRVADGSIAATVASQRPVAERPLAGDALPLGTTRGRPKQRPDGNRGANVSRASLARDTQTGAATSGPDSPISEVHHEGHHAE